MGLPYVTSFCCCLGLEVGAKLVGFMHLVASISLLVVCSLFAQSVRGLAGTVEDAEDQLYSTWYSIALGVAALSVLHVLLALTLLYGVYKRNTIALRVWISLMCVLFVGGLAYVAVTAATHGFASSGSDIFLAFLQGLAMFAVVAYSILAVFSYYLVLRSTEQMDLPQKVDY